MIAQRGIELDIGVQERLVGQLNFFLIILRPFSPIQVVPEHQNELEGIFLVEPRYLPSHLVLRSFARTGVAEDREAERTFLEGKPWLLGRQQTRQQEQ